MFSQKEAVYQASLEILKQANLSLGDKPISSVMSKDLRKLVIDKIIKMIKSNEVSFKATVSNRKTLENDKLLNTYVSGLVSNHWKRDKRLNGTVK